MTVKEVYQFDSGGIVYKDATGKILGTGTAGDSAAPDPGDLEGVFLYCQSPARTLYIVANQSFKYRVKNSLAITTTPSRDQLLTILSQNFFFRVSGGGPETQNLDDVLTIGNNAGANDIDLNGNDILNVNNINGVPFPYHPNLDEVLQAGNNAGANDIDMNAKDIKNVDEIEVKTLISQTGANIDITPDLSLILNPGSGQIDCKTNDLINVNEISSLGDLFLNPVGSINANGKTLNMTGGEIHNSKLIHSQNNNDITIEGKGTGDIILKTNNSNKIIIPDTGEINFYSSLNAQNNDIKNVNNLQVTTINTLTPVYTTRTISTNSPLTGGGDLTTNRTLSINQATALTNGYLSSTDWTTFNNKQNALGFNPVTDARTITINGTAQNLTADRSWNTYAIVPVQSVVSAATVTPTSTNQLVIITAQAAALTLANPTGAFVEGQPLMIRIKDNGTARAINYDTNYRAIGVTLPTTTVINKTTYLGIIYNAVDGKWDVIGVTTQA